MKPVCRVTARSIVPGCLLVVGCLASDRHGDGIGDSFNGGRIAHALAQKWRAERSAGRPFHQNMIDRWGVEIAKEHASTWLEDVRAVFFAFEADPQLRLSASFILVGAADRWAFDRLIEELPNLKFRVPTMAGIYVLGRLCTRKDVPELIAMLGSASPQARMCASWALANYTYNHLGTPDRGIRGVDLYERWRLWWDEHGTDTKTEWFHMGVEASLKDLLSTSPAVRGYAYHWLGRLIGSAIRNYDFLGTGHEAWEKEWHRLRDGVKLKEDERFAWYADAFPPVTNWARTPYWDARESSFEEARRDDLKEWAGRLLDYTFDDFWIARNMELLTNVEFALERKPGEDILDYRRRTRPFLNDQWTKWYCENAPRLKWDWSKGHFAVTDGR